MLDDHFIENLNWLGLPAMENQLKVDVNNTLAEVVKSNETRLWEGFAVLLANAARDYHFDFDKVQKHFTVKKDAKNFKSLLILSLALYQHYHLAFKWSNRLIKTLSPEDKNRLKEYKNLVARGKKFRLGNRQLDLFRLKQMFNNYFEKDAEKTKKLKQKHEELSLEYALSQLFSPKQKELFRKKLKGELLTKTEKEYFSRTVKKKIVALANPELHSLARQLMQH